MSYLIATEDQLITPGNYLHADNKSIDNLMINVLI